tara:strand:- start:948 stop:1118 length:171 start_codon:yes stop_codon:yes gene_type:complete
MNVQKFNSEKALLGQYIFILGGMLIFKMQYMGGLSIYDPYSVLFLYYIGRACGPGD